MTMWSKLKVPELKAELKKRGLPQTGLKADLVARLTSVENESGFDSEATIKGDPVETSPELNSQTSATDAPKSPLTESPKDSIPTEARLPTAEHVATSSASTVHSHSVALPDPDPHGSHEPSTAHTSLSVADSRSVLPSEPSVMSSGYLKEVVDDTHKRKRRSQSPPPSVTDSRSKRARPDHEPELTSSVDMHMPSELVVTSAADTQQVEEDVGVEHAEIVSYAAETVSHRSDGLSATDVVDVAMKDDMVEPRLVNKTEDNHRAEYPDLPRDDASLGKTRDSRFKDHFPGHAERSTDDQTNTKSGAPFNSSDDMLVDHHDRSVAPSMHAATAALYIRDFMRPLNRATLQDHIVNLATAPDTAPDPEVIVDFYLDPVRTHAFISFTSVSAASRVRSELHDRVWPNETNRKPLWVDFIPSEMVQQWIAQEESTAGGARSVGKKWEVVYNIDGYNHVTASLEEKGRFPAPTNKPTITPAPSEGPSYRGIQGAPSGPRSQHITPRAPPSQSHLELLFKHTTTKPVLYFQPVSRELAEKRLDHLEDATSNRYNSQDPPTEINRYTFEEGDALVDRGPEIFPGIRPPPGYRGRGGGDRGGPRGSGYRGGYRGGFRDSGERYRDNGNVYGRGEGYAGRGDGHVGRGGGYGGRDGYRGRGGRYEGAGREMRDSRDRRY